MLNNIQIENSCLLTLINVIKQFLNILDKIFIYYLSFIIYLENYI